MRRLAATLYQDIVVQARNGFYAAVAFVLLVWAALLSQLAPTDLRLLLPPLVLGNALMSCFYFVGGLTLLEKAEGSLLARAITPLRPGEYLGARVVSLALLTLIENLAVILVFVGPGFHPLPLAAGILLGGAGLTLIGFLVVTRYSAINEYLLPSVLVTSLLSLPAMAHLAGWSFWPLYLHPLQPAMQLMAGGFRPLAAWEWAYGLLAGAAWAGLFFAWATRAYRRVAAEGL